MTEPQRGDDRELRTILQENVGMSQYEADIYLALVDAGKQSMSELSRTSGVPNQRVYDTIENLRSRGFVEVNDEYPKEAYAIDPYEAILPVQRQITDAQKRLEELYQTAAGDESSIQLFKSENTIKSHIQDLIASAEDSLFVLCSVDTLSQFRTELADRNTISTRLLLSDLELDHARDEVIELEVDVSDLADDVHGITSSEPFLICADRRRAFYWTGQSGREMSVEEQGFYVTNPELAFLFDRFLSDSLWPQARPVYTGNRDETPSFPAEYVRLRDCTRDLRRVTTERPVDSFEIEFEGYDTTTRERVHERGTLQGYYFSEYDVRTYLQVQLDADGDGQGETASVGAWGATQEDYEIRRITVRERSHDGEGRALDGETEDHLAVCRQELDGEIDLGRAVLGFEVVVDTIRRLVEKRSGPQHTTDMTEFASFPELLLHSDATGAAPTIEWTEAETLPGGHTVHAADVLSTAGYDLTLVGPFGEPIREEFADVLRGHDVISIGTPTDTDYVMFDDGKFMLTEPGAQTEINWETLVESVGVDELAARLDGATVLDIGVWSAIPSLPSVLEDLTGRVWPRLEEPPNHVVVTIGDIQRLSDRRIREGIDALASVDDVVPCTIVGNRSQTERLADFTDATGTEQSLNRLVRSVREQIGVSRCVTNTLETAVASSADEVVEAKAPVKQATTGATNADDHFNAGLSLALGAGLPDGASLIVAHVVASYFMEHDEAPDLREIRSHLESYDETDFELA